ncbi:hypothetical protein ACWEIJ_09330 [Lentzea sp. NPDC004789]
MAGGGDEVFTAIANYDADPGPFRSFAREYVRLADEELGSSLEG